MTTVEQHPFRPDYAIPPGETLRDRLAELNLTQAELAARAGLSTKHVNQIMQGIAPITLETAIALDRITGIPASIWNRREADYREALLRFRPRELTPEDHAWLNVLPTKELKKRGCLPHETDQGRLFDAVLSFFGVADRAAYERVWKVPVASFRRSGAYKSSPGSVVSWLRIAQLDAQGRKVAPYSASTFRKVLRDIRSLTARGHPNDIVDLCATAGVVVVFVSEVKGCRISGAAWWTSPYRAVIALSDRYKKDDRFWFSFFHEAAHILLHSKKETFVDDDTDDDVVEDEANAFAADFLIPPDYKPRLYRLTTDEEAEAFAKEIGIAAGIVVGRLQHDDKWGWNRGNNLKRGLQIVDDE
jgi:HTH-type transcriptional regulator / antitoxin HigA